MSELQEFSTVKELAKLLKVTERTVFRLIERGEIAVHRIGRVKRFRRDDIEAYLRRARSGDDASARD